MGNARETGRRSPLGILFLTLFLDLMGFSIIFPLFPAILDHYFVTEGESGLFGTLIETLRGWSGDPTQDKYDWRLQALFGGVLGSVYSLLQFLTAPFWGRLSDRIGRRPVLLGTILGQGAAYLLWFVSGSFLVFILSRVLGGIMSGNIATATAAVADSTGARDRARGMGIIGAAFGLGFILGPAIGGALALIETGDHAWLAKLSGHPFAACALGAVVLTAVNLVWVALRFQETLPPDQRGQGGGRAPLGELVGKSASRAIWRTSLTYFVFLIAFSGMEFTLTFLVRERLEWDPPDMIAMFVFVGLVVALVQGGVVRRVTPHFGERRVAMVGLLLIVPGLVLLAFVHESWVLYVALAPMSVGSGLAIPTLTSLVSLHAPATEQGRVLGGLRSLGALARTIGPFLAALLFWKLGSPAPYLMGGVAMLIPMWLLVQVPQPETGE